MAITAYTGRPGNGKSYGVVENAIVPALSKHRRVFTNIPMDADKCLEKFQCSPVQFDTKDILDNPDWWTDVFEPGALLVLDEAWRLWPSGLKANNARDQDKAFLAEHRHMVGEDNYSTEIILITQDLAQVSSFVRVLIETTFVVSKLAKVGAKNSYRVDIYTGAVSGANPPITKRERQDFGKFSKDIFALYSSHTQSSTGMAGDETRSDDRFNVFGGWKIKLGIAAFVSILLAFFYLGSSFLSSWQDQTSQDIPSNSVQKVPSLNSVEIASKPLVSDPPFLSAADSVYLTGSLVTQNAKFIDYKVFSFEVLFGSDLLSLTDMDLFKLGYEISYIKSCLVLIKGYDFNSYVTCPTIDQQDFSNPSNSSDSLSFFS